MGASALQAVTGFGFALIAAPLLLAVLPAPTAIATTMCVSLGCLLILSFQSRKHADRSIVRTLSLGSLIGIPLGAYTLTHANPHIIKTLASAVTLVIALGFVAKTQPVERVYRRPPSAFLFAVGTLSGFLTTSVSMPGPPVVLALDASGMPKSAFRATGSAFFAVVYAFSATTLIISGVIDVSVLLLVASLLPPAIIGNKFGDRFFDRIPQSVFNKIIPALLMLTAANNLLKR